MTHLLRRTAALACAVAAMSLGSPAHAVLGNTVAHGFSGGGDGLPAVQVTLTASAVGAQFECKAFSTIVADFTRAVCRLSQAGVLVASSDSGYVRGQTAATASFHLGSGLFLEACVTGFTRVAQQPDRTNSACASVLVS